MTKNELKTRIANTIRESGYRKLVKCPRHTFHISDDEGNEKDFVVRPSDREVSVTADDVGMVLEALYDVICDELQHGRPVSLFGFGAFTLRYSSPRKVPRFDGEGYYAYDGQYVPKFKPGEKICAAAKLFSKNLKEQSVDVSALPYNEEDDDSMLDEEE